jgi:hypothetical protein
MTAATMKAADDKVNIDLSLEELILASDAIRFTTVYLNGDKAHVKMSSLLDKVERVIYSEGSKPKE